MDDAALKQARILVVCDDRATIRFLERILRAAGWADLRSTADARTAPRLLAKFQPDILLLGVRTTDAAGLELLEELRPQRSDGLPVLIITADGSPEAREAALAAGASDVLTKPVTADDLLARVRDLLDARLRQPAVGSRNGSVGGAGGEGDGLPIEVLERLALVAEYRDDLSRGEHVKRVGQTAALLARALGLPEDQVDMIRLAAPLHDLGKIAIPEEILLKPGRLTPEEFKVMKTHTTIGAVMLEGSRHALLQMAERIARSHHERWDGAGFPHGLRRDAIPIEARIVAVADAFDAMNSDRPYRKALSSEEVWDILVDGAGKQWDLAVVDALASLVRMEVAVDRPFDVTAFFQREQMALDPRR